MPPRNDAALDFLLTRRSRPAKTLTGPAPDREALMPLLTAAARSPDHGKLEPWRFVVLQGDALQRVAGAVAARGAEIGKGESDIEKARRAFADSPLCVVVVESPKESEKIPAIEQTYSAGAVCLALLNAALAAGWGANWLTGYGAYDRPLVERELGLSQDEQVAGFIHIGSESVAPPDRPRPDLDQIVTWVEA